MTWVAQKSNFLFDGKKAEEILMSQLFIPACTLPSPADICPCSIRLWSIGRWINSVRAGWHRLSSWWHFAGEKNSRQLRNSICKLSSPSHRLSARTIIIGGKPGTILLAVRRVWFHHQNFKSGVSHASRQINQNRSKVGCYLHLYTNSNAANIKYKILT